MSEQNKARSRRFFEEALGGQHNLDVISEIWAKDCITYPMELKGPEALKGMVQAFVTAFPDLSVSVEEQVAEGDTVVTRSTFRGTHEGVFMGQHEPTGKPVTFIMVALHHHEDGYIKEGYGPVNMASILQQIGA